MSPSVSGLSSDSAACSGAVCYSHRISCDFFCAFWGVQKFRLFMSLTCIHFLCFSPDVMSYNAVIDACARIGDVTRQCLSVSTQLEEMHRWTSPISLGWNGCLWQAVKLGVTGAESWLDKMKAARSLVCTMQGRGKDSSIAHPTCRNEFLKRKRGSNGTSWNLRANHESQSPRHVNVSWHC